ncbi:MAG: deoxyribodipyrimidine photo-lyase [Bacteroidales bacterium]|nr:deoxyribodipyrimidine photo-lyase [Bacteroidales bacterium]
MKNIAISLFWFRRDLRIDDNNALFESLRSGLPVLPIYIFEPEYTSKIPFNRNRELFIENQLNNLNNLLLPYNSQIESFEGDALDIFKVLFSVYNIKSVFINEEYEPNTIKRDNNIEAFCKAQGADFFQFKDHVFFHKNEITKPDGSPYTIFTPYSKKWLETLKHRNTAILIRSFIVKFH